MMATAEEVAMLRARLEGTVPNTGTAVDPHANEFLPRTQASLGRLAANPSIQGLSGAGIGGASLANAVNSARMVGVGLGGSTGLRDVTSFQRELEGQPAHVDLQPMPSGPELTMPSTPTLAQNYGRSSQGGGGGAGGSGMGSLKADYLQAQRNQFGTFDEGRDLVERRGEMQGERIDRTAQLQELEAARKQRDAEVMQEHQDKVAAKHEAFLARNQELANEIGTTKIDPSRVMGDKGLGEKLALVIAGALSGSVGQGPQFMSRLDGMVDQGVRAQMANADNVKAKLSARQSIFGQMMAESGDRKVAEAQTRALMLESVKQKLGADAARLGIPEVTNAAQMHMNEIEQTKINPLRVQMTGDALRSAQAQAAAQANAQRAAEHEAWTRSMQVGEMALKKDELDLKRNAAGGKEGADDNGRFVSTGQDAEGNPTGYLARNEQSAEKQENQRKSTEKLLGLIDEAQKTRAEQGTAGRLGNALNPARAVGAYTPEWESKMKILRGRMTGAIKEADALGTLDAGSQAYADALTGGDALTGIGGKADDQLNAFRESLQAGKKTDEAGSAGARATRIVDPRTGRERVIITGNPNAPRAAMPDSVKKR
jgi:hypothetical protein